MRHASFAIASLLIFSFVALSIAPGCQSNGLPTTQTATISLTAIDVLTKAVDDGVKATDAALPFVTVAQADKVVAAEKTARTAIGDAQGAIVSGNVNAATLFNAAVDAVNAYNTARAKLPTTKP